MATGDRPDDRAATTSRTVQHHHAPVWAMALAFVVGLLVVAQSRSNGGLAVAVGDGLLAAVLSFVTGAVILAVIIAARPATRRALTRALPAQLRSGRLRWWHLAGGLGGALLVAGQGLAVPVLGVALFTVVMVAGNTGTSLVVDRVGLGPGAARAVTARRVVAALGATAAVALAVGGRAAAGDLAVWAVVLVLVAGAAVAIQPALNGQVALRTGDVLAATAVNFAVGLTALVVALAVEHLAGHAWTAPPPPWEEPLLWLGGPVGVLFIAVGSLVVRPLGVLLFGLLNIAGQLTGSLVSDLLFPTPGTVVGWQLLAGAALTGASVALAATRPRGARVSAAT
ncbi:MAG: DMT family transporter [Actinomycetales bacterium]|nr:DMT family transporter [Actinomycetales bacterium]